MSELINSHLEEASSQPMEPVEPVEVSLSGDPAAVVPPPDLAPAAPAQATEVPVTQRWTVSCALAPSQIESAVDSFNVYVGDLPGDVADDELRTLFESFGTILDVRVMRDRASGLCKGYAFVHMSTKESQERIVASDAASRSLRGHLLRVRISEQKTTLFLGNLPMELSKEEVEAAIHALCDPYISPASYKVDIKVPFASVASPFSLTSSLFRSLAPLSHLSHLCLIVWPPS